MEKVIYSNMCGCGIILNSDESEVDYFEPKEFIINGAKLNTGDFTNLSGLFNKPVRYVGVLKGDSNCMCFRLGYNVDFFGSKTFYSCFFWISESRLVNKYTENSARDFNWINGKWK